MGATVEGRAAAGGNSCRVSTIHESGPLFSLEFYHGVTRFLFPWGDVHMQILCLSRRRHRQYGG